MANSIDIKELRELLMSGSDPVLLDVRRKADYEATPVKIAGATWHDPEKIDAWLKELPTGRPTVVYCVKGGSISQSVVERMREKGHEAAFLEGGLKAWTEGGHPVEETKP